MNGQRGGLRDYWEANIEGFGGFYAELSREELLAPRWLRRLYRLTIMRIEGRLMLRRYRACLRFMDAHVRQGMTVADVGCGTGVLTVELLRRGARVIAVDYAERALALTRRLVMERASEQASDVEYVLADIARTPLPRCDAAMAIGVTPYVDDIAGMYENILTRTSIFYCLFVDRRHWANRLRRWIPVLNVRGLRFFDPGTIDGLLARHGFRCVQRERLGTGFLDLALPQAAPSHDIVARHIRSR